ncbi:MAG: type IV secretion system DNA-binding domain-containing protein [Candidatus Pacebacteria bacterium]|nr:type IV secretion system DNA-binding domain-containing protein [Candidatus Paceibacterota bacterium]
MDNNDEKVTYFAEADARGKQLKFGIKQKDRSRHVYVIGKTGMGKSTVLENMAVQDIQSGEGIAFIDPHGKTADLLLEYVPKERIDDVLYFAPFDLDYPVSFNVMEDVGYDKRYLVVSGLMSSFKKVWGEETWSDRMEYILGNTLLALLEYPDSTLLSVNKMLADKSYRNKVIANITDPSVKAYWTEEFASYTERFAAEATPAIQNKIGQFTANPLIRNIIGQPKSSFDLREMMDQKKIVIVNLSKGRVGESNANLLGSLLITKMYLSAMSRADNEGGKMPRFYLFVDEFQSFANESFADILSEARKYELSLTIAHQYIEQMSEEVRAAVFGNVGTMITFRVGAYDAEILEKEFAPKFTAEDLVNLGFVQIYLKLMIDGISSQPFSAKTLPPIEKEEKSYKKEVIESSRRKYGKPRSEVEELVKKLVADGGQEKQGDHEKRERSRYDKPRNNQRQQQRPQQQEKQRNPFANIVIPEKPKQQNRQPEKKKDTKKPSKENVSDLKAALSSLVSDKKGPEKTEKEIPEGELKKILD